MTLRLRLRRALMAHEAERRAGRSFIRAWEIIGAILFFVGLLIWLWRRA